MSELVKAAYIHVPFCIHRCGYCDFTVIANRDDLIETYLECLELELTRELSGPQPVETLFLGGGTPNYLAAPELERLFQLLDHWFPRVDGAEFSMECNPEHFTLEQMEVMAAHGVNRVSLGVQSFQTEHLKTLERGHAPETVSEVVTNLRTTGFENIAFDLIYGVPEQSLAEWSQTLDSAIQLSPQHISTYGLTFEKGTSFWTRRLKNELTPAAEELEREMYALGIQRLSDSGYEQYEISNFSIPGWQCRHNQVYWLAEPFYGFGPGAAAYLNGQRTVRYRSVKGWINHVMADQSGIASSEELTTDLAAREAVMLGLRKIQGINLAHFEARFGLQPQDLAKDAFDQFVAQGLLEISAGHLRLTYEGRFLADTVVAEFL